MRQSVRRSPRLQSRQRKDGSWRLARRTLIEAEPLIEEAKKEWQTVGPAAQVLLDLISHHVNQGSSTAEAAETVRAALNGSMGGVAKEHMTDRSMSCVTVFGGTGFVGRRVVSRLRGSGTRVRVVSRHRGLSNEDGLEHMAVDAHDQHSVEAAVVGADGVVNAISLYVEHGSDTFHSVHVETAAQVARAAKQAGVKRFVHVSGIGANPGSSSAYIRSRGEGEAVVQTAFPGAVVVRPAVIFGSDDAFLTTILRLLRSLPAYPLFGDGRTKLQPVDVDDVAAGIAQILRQSQKPYPVYEFAGPRVYSYEELLRAIARVAGLRPTLVRTPFVFWGALARIAEILPQPPLTRNQVELMQIDTAASGRLPGLRTLGISPRSLEEELETMSARRNPAQVARVSHRPPDAASPQILNPGDEAAPQTPGTGDDICPKCHGSGKANGASCANCGGTGKVTQAIGGA